MHRRIGVEHRGDVVLGVAGGEQHAGDREDALRPGLAQLVEALVDHRVGEFEITVFHRHVRQPLTQALGQHGEFADGTGIAAAMAAQHHPGVGGQSQEFRHVSPLSRGKGRVTSTNQQPRPWSPIWVDRTGHEFQPLKERCARAAL